MNRPGQPPQRPPNLGGPAQGLGAGGQFRGGPFPPTAFGMPARTTLGQQQQQQQQAQQQQQQQAQQQGFPGMPRSAGQSMVLPSPSFLAQRGQGAFPFGSAIGQQSQQHVPGQGHQPSQATSVLGQQLQQQQAQAQAQAAAASSGALQHLSNPNVGASTQGTNTNQSTNDGGSGGGGGGAGGLDPNDFPALGSGSGTMNASTNSPATTLASSYASQAGTGVIAPGNGTAQGQGAGQGGQGQNANSAQTRDFTPDDFPALGGQPTGAQNLQNQSNSQDGNQNQNHPPGLNGFETRVGPGTGTTLPPGLLNLSGAQRSIAADVEKRATSKLNTWNGTGGAASQVQQQNGSLQPGQQLSVPPGVPSPFPQQQQQSQSQSQNPGAFGAGVNAADGSAAPPNANPTAAPQTPAQQILMSAADRWGLLGLLSAIKNADADQTLLAIGTDLGTMGLDMQNSGSLFSTFITPWSDSSAAHTVEPDYHLPQCYSVNAPAPGPGKAQAFSEETLFYMFYAHPRDALQEVAAQELYTRNWRFNKELRLWLTKEMTRHRQSKTLEGGAGEQGFFTYWDPDMWEKSMKEFTVMYKDLESKDGPPAFAAGMTLQASSAQAGVGGGVGGIGGGVGGIGGGQQSQVVRGNFPGLGMTAAAM